MLVVCVCGIGAGALFLWMFFNVPASRTIAGWVLDLFGAVLGGLLITAGVMVLLGLKLGYPRLVLHDNKLIVEGMLRSSILNLDNFGKAAITRSGRLTFLAFFTLEEEQALAQKGDFSGPNAFNAAKTVALSPFSGGSLEGAQEIADQINELRRRSFDGKASTPNSDVFAKGIKQRVRRRLLTAFLIIMAVSILAAFA